MGVGGGRGEVPREGVVIFSLVCEGLRGGGIAEYCEIDFGQGRYMYYYSRVIIIGD